MEIQVLTKQDVDDNLENRDININNNLHSIMEMVRSLYQVTDFQVKKEKIQKIEDQFQIINIDLGLFEADTQQQMEYKDKCRSYKKKIKILYEEYEYIKFSEKKIILLDTEDMNGTNCPNSICIHNNHISEYPDQSLYLEYGSKLHQETLEMADSTLCEMNQTLDMGKSAIEKVQHQTEQMVRMQNNISEIDAVLASTKKILYDMLKRTLTDKYIILLVLFVAIAFFIYWLI